MGVTITANNSKHSFHMGYRGFFELRKNIALAYNKEFGKQYAKLAHCYTKEDYKEYNNKTNRLIRKLELEDDDILDFLYSNDCGGKASHKTCGKMYKFLTNADLSGKRFQYAAWSSESDYDEFKEFLHECYSHRRNMVWL